MVLKCSGNALNSLSNRLGVFLLYYFSTLVFYTKFGKISLYIKQSATGHPEENSLHRSF